MSAYDQITNALMSRHGLIGGIPSSGTPPGVISNDPSSVNYVPGTPPAQTAQVPQQHHFSLDPWHFGLMGKQISSFPQPWQDRINQRWQIFGGGQPVPEYFGDYLKARTNWQPANERQVRQLWGWIN